MFKLYISLQFLFPNILHTIVTKSYESLGLKHITLTDLPVTVSSSCHSKMQCWNLHIFCFLNMIYLVPCHHRVPYGDVKHLLLELPPPTHHCWSGQYITDTPTLTIENS